MAEDEPREPEPYEPGPPETSPEEGATRGGEAPTREQVAERNERFSRPRKPMGPTPEDDRRAGDDEAGPPADVPATPAPEPPPEPAEG